MNYDKFKHDEYFSDFDTSEYLSELFYRMSSDGDRQLFVIDRNAAFMLLKAHKFSPLTDKKKRSISRMISAIAKEGGVIPESYRPKKPVLINVRTMTIVDGITLLFVALYQRSPRVIHIELVV